MCNPIWHQARYLVEHLNWPTVQCRCSLILNRAVDSSADPYYGVDKHFSESASSHIAAYSGSVSLASGSRCQPGYQRAFSTEADTPESHTAIPTSRTLSFQERGYRYRQEK